MMKGEEFEDTGTVVGSKTACGSGEVVRWVGNRIELTLKILGASFKCRGPFDLVAATVKPGQRLHVAGVFQGISPAGVVHPLSGPGNPVAVKKSLEESRPRAQFAGRTPGAWLVEGCTFKPVMPR
jgi:hypothetical protein